MIIHTPCKICGVDMPLILAPTTGPAMHPACDTRAQQDTPHPAAGNLPRLEHQAHQALKAATLTEDGSPQWQQFDRICEQIRAVQHNTTYPGLKWAAQYYSQTLGWPVFPLQPGGKAPLTRRGFKDATTNPQQIQAWWEQTPEANIGLPTGVYFDVVDVDTPICETLWHTMTADEDAEGYGLARTSSGGYHLYVPPMTSTAKNRAGAFGPGIDYRTRGGYVVAPWSLSLIHI